jgi:O-antigen/teichoic acid export membrane protein
VFRLFVTLSAGETLSRLLYVIAFMLLARKLGETSLGQIGLVMTITSYALLVVQQGFNTPAIREVSRDPTQLRRYADTILGLRLLLSVLAFAALGGFALWSGLSNVQNMLLLVSSIRLFGAALSLQWPFQALQRPRSLALSGIIAQIVFLIAVISAPDATWILFIAGAQVAGELLASIYLWLLLSLEFGFIYPSWTPLSWVAIGKESWPMSLSMVLGNLLYNFDIFALAWLAGNAEIGLYIACYRCTTVFNPLFVMLSASIFPTLAKLHPDYQSVRRLGMQIAGLTLPVCLLVAGAITWWAKPILSLLYGPSFQHGSTVLQVLIWALPIQGVRIVMRQILLASHLQKQEAFTMGMAVAANITGDLILVPFYGPLGCAISTVFSELVLLTTAQYLVSRNLNIAPTQTAA